MATESIVTNTPRVGETPEQTAARYNRPGQMLYKERDPLLQEREKTHGSFEMNALVSQKIKTIMHDCEEWDNLDTIYREALDMIALKLSRILSGQANFKDHWDDIAGYAKLASEACASHPRSSGS